MRQFILDKILITGVQGRGRGRGRAGDRRGQPSYGAKISKIFKYILFFHLDFFYSRPLQLIKDLFIQTINMIHCKFFVSSNLTPITKF